jgi:hypothetical protein
MTEREKALARLIDRSLAGLPDSFRERKELLNDLLTLTPISWPQRRTVSGMLLNLHDHERSTEVAQLKFKELLGHTPAK